VTGTEKKHGENDCAQERSREYRKRAVFLVGGWVEWGDSCTIDAFIWVNA